MDYGRTSYDVFISFRGEDTRNTFVGHLYKELHEQLRISTFMDDKILAIGDNLDQRLVESIEESKLFIVVLSKGYASSKWCLRELAKIIDCMTDMTNRIFPVFFYVDPSDVRHQSGSFKENFDEHDKIAQTYTGEQKEKYLKEIQNWRDSLTRISGHVGEVVTKDSPQVNNIERIAQQINERLRSKLVAPHRSKNLFEIEVSLAQMNMLLDLDLNDVHFVGIVGMCGIGKTTLAEVVYENISLQFWKNSCFLRIADQNDLVSLQHQLLSKLMVKDIQIWDEDHGAELIQNYLSSRKVLIVLDGVKNKRQLEKLAGSPNWFGPKSRVIITTQYKDILRQPNHKIQEHNMELLCCYESAFLLFCKHAFRDGLLDENLKVLCDEIVQSIGRFPLGLKEIALFLYGKGKDIWEEELESLTKIRNKRLFDTLKISFDDLDTTSQQVFLDLACFFNGSAKDKVIEILKSLDYLPHGEIQTLCDRCFIEVRQEKILIPNFIQAMGQQIEREANKRSRFWLREDLQNVFDENGVKYIKGIVLDMKNEIPDEVELELEAKLFTEMRCLRILEIGNVKLNGDITNLSKQLRFLHWRSYPSESLPSNFASQYLFGLLLPVSRTKQLWNGQKRFEKLKVVDASDSHDLVETPNFTEVPNLERLILHGCTRLHTIGSSISTLNHLVYLDVTLCFSLKNFDSIYKCKKLTHTGLKISGSSLDPRKTFEGHFSLISLDESH